MATVIFCKERRNSTVENYPELVNSLATLMLKARNKNCDKAAPAKPRQD